MDFTNIELYLYSNFKENPSDKYAQAFIFSPESSISSKMANHWQCWKQKGPQKMLKRLSSRLNVMLELLPPSPFFSFSKT
jgi:hypothetical protein